MLDNTIEGFVDNRELPRGYKYSEASLAYVGKNNTYNIGDKVEVKVKSANKEARTIDFALVREYLKNEEKEEIKPKKSVKIK